MPENVSSPCLICLIQVHLALLNMLYLMLDSFTNEFCNSFLGKAKRLKQAKEEAQLDIEKYRQEQEKKFREKEAKVGLGGYIKFKGLIRGGSRAILVKF